MTNQEAFTAVWNHFVVQQQPPGMEEDGCCRYRTAAGGRCAIGVLIPDSRYKPDMECDDAALIRKVLSDLLGDCDRHLLEALQAGHDNAAVRPETFPMTIQARLRETANAFGLQVPA